MGGTETILAQDATADSENRLFNAMDYGDRKGISPAGRAIDPKARDGISFSIFAGAGNWEAERQAPTQRIRYRLHKGCNLVQQLPSGRRRAVNEQIGRGGVK